MIRFLATLSFCAIALASTAAVAIPPPLPSYSRYGPVTQCLNGYRVEVTGDEAVTLDQGVMVLNDEFRLFLDPERTSRPESDRPVAVEVPGLGQAQRYRVAANRGRVSLYTGDRDITEYVLPANGGGAVLVRSDRFDGSARDLELLARVAAVDPARDQCGTFAPPDYAGRSFAALYWSPVRHPGPGFHCQQGIGYPVAAGESTQRPWLQTNAQSDLHLADGVALGLRGPTDPARRYRRTRGPIEAGYELSTRELSAEVHELLLIVPESRRGRDEPAHLQQIAIQYAPGQEAAAQAFARRLEFVGRNDRRCPSATRGS
jgi:hypothetical protein